MKKKIHTTIPTETTENFWLHVKKFSGITHVVTADNKVIIPHVVGDDDNLSELSTGYYVVLCRHHYVFDDTKVARMIVSAPVLDLRAKKWLKFDRDMDLWRIEKDYGR